MSLENFSAEGASPKDVSQLNDIKRKLEEEVIKEALRPHKTIRDAVHGDILLNHLEIEVLDTHEMQRLRKLLQLGLTHLVYPSATHTRFSHSLGTLHVAESIWSYYFRDNPIKDFEVKDLIDERTVSNLEEAELRLDYMHLILRLAALIHDLTTLPFGHSLEDEGELILGEDPSGNVVPVDQWSDIERVLFFMGRDSNIRKKIKNFIKDSMIRALERRGDIDIKVNPKINDYIDRWSSDLEKKITADVLSVILYYDEEILNTILKRLGLTRFRSSIIKENRFISEILTNTVCADYVDYVLRDFTMCGLGNIPSIDRLLRYAAISKERRCLYFRLFKPRISKTTSINERIRLGVFSDLMNLLNLRIKLAESVHQHRTKIKATSMLLRAVEIWSKRQGGSINWKERIYEMGDLEFLQTMKEESDIAGRIIEMIERRELYKALYSATYREIFGKFSPGNVKKMINELRRWRVDIEDTLENWNGLEEGTLALYIPPLPERMFKEWKVRVGWVKHNGESGSDGITLKTLEDIAKEGEALNMPGRSISGIEIYEYRVFLEHDLLKKKYESIWTIYLLGDKKRVSEDRTRRILADLMLICKEIGNIAIGKEVSCPRLEYTIIESSSLFKMAHNKNMRLEELLKKISARRTSKKKPYILMKREDIEKLLSQQS